MSLMNLVRLILKHVTAIFSLIKIEEKVSSKPLIQSEIDSSVTPIFALFS